MAVPVTVEEARLDRLHAAGIGVSYQRLLRALPVASLSPATPAEAADLGSALWRAAVAAVQSAADGGWDDRDLYWARLAVSARLRQSADADSLLAFERASRGFDAVSFAGTDTFKVLITGFDPFHLDVHLDQSNPSGLAALVLDGAVLETGSGAARVEAALFPVRFADFDAGMVEAFLEPLLMQNPPDLVVTLSMGRDAFDLERFPGRRRSSPVTDNLNVLTGANPEAPLLPLLHGAPLDGPEFVEFTLPAAAMAAVAGDFQVRDNRHVRTMARGEFEASSLADLGGEIAVAGSGGGYLSNEISYRALLVNERVPGSGSPVPMGHLHTPRVQGYDADVEAGIVRQIELLLIAAVEALDTP